MDGWAEWGSGTRSRPIIGVVGVNQLRYCPRCDTATVWKNADGGVVLSCDGCGLHAGDLLKPDEVDRLLVAFR